MSVGVNFHARHHLGVNLLALLARAILGGALLVAGGLKALHPYQAAAAVRAYELLPVSVLIRAPSSIDGLKVNVTSSY